MTFSYKKTLNCYFQHTIQGIDNDKSTSRNGVYGIFRRISRVHSGVAVAIHLLPSRLYCRYRSFNGSAVVVRGLPWKQILPQTSARGLYRRSGISPCPEDMRMQMYAILSVLQNILTCLHCSRPLRNLASPHILYRLGKTTVSANQVNLFAILLVLLLASAYICIYKRSVIVNKV